MAFCQYCGKEVNQQQDFCLNCGASLRKDEYVPRRVPNPNDTGGAGWGVLGFFVPVVGLILYLVWKDDQPKNSKAAGVGALIGVIASFVLAILYVIFIIVILSIYAEGYYGFLLM